MGAYKLIDILGPHKIAYLPYVQWVSGNLSTHTYTEISFQFDN